VIFRVGFVERVLPRFALGVGALAGSQRDVAEYRQVY